MFPADNIHQSLSDQLNQSLADQSLDCDLPALQYPINEVKQEVLDTFLSGQNLVLAAPTGSGKTTQIPPWLLRSPISANGTICIVQKTIDLVQKSAERIALEQNWQFGDTVGYITGPSRKVADDTPIVFVTAGVFKSMLLTNPKLAGYSVVLFDEVDDRSVFGDLALGHVTNTAQTTGRPLIGLMSETLNTSKLSEYLGNSKIVKSNQRMFDIAYQYHDQNISNKRMAQCCAKKAYEVLIENPSGGNILVFLPTVPSIRMAIKAFKEFGLQDVEVLPYYSRLQPKKKQQVFQASDQRRVIFSTSIAERGQTLPMIEWVIDSGQQLISNYNFQTKTKKYIVVNASKDQMKQRSGRTGRQLDGTCIRMMTEANYEQRPESLTPEILRSPLEDVVLHMLSLQADDTKDYRFKLLDSPDKEAWESAEKKLVQMGAIDQTPNFRINDYGKELLKFGCSVENAHQIIQGSKKGCASEMIILAAVEMTRSIFYDSFEQNISHNTIKSTSNDQTDCFKAIDLYRAALSNRFDPTWCEQLNLNREALLQIHSYQGKLLKAALFNGYEVNDSEASPRQLCEVFSEISADQLCVRLAGKKYLHLATLHTVRLPKRSKLHHAKYLIAHKLISFDYNQLGLIDEASVFVASDNIVDKVKGVFEPLQLSFQQRQDLRDINPVKRRKSLRKQYNFSDINVKVKQIHIGKKRLTVGLISAHSKSLGTIQVGPLTTKHSQSTLYDYLHLKLYEIAMEQNTYGPSLDQPIDYADPNQSYKLGRLFSPQITEQQEKSKRIKILTKHPDVQVTSKVKIHKVNNDLQYETVVRISLGDETSKEILSPLKPSVKQSSRAAIDELYQYLDQLHTNGDLEQFGFPF